MTKADASGSDLTSRERAVFDLIRKGLTNIEVAQQLGISASTVKAHTANIFKKLNVSNRTEAAGLEFIPQATPTVCDPISRDAYDTGTPSSPPAIAVTPLSIDDADKLDVALADAIVDDLITRLGRCWFPVIARCSSFALRRDELQDARTVGDSLNARFLVEGSFQRASPRARLNLRLVDTSSGRVLWGERYAFNIQEVFEVQNELCAAVAHALSEAVVERVASEALELAETELQPWQLAARGMWAFWKGTRSEHEQAQGWLTQALSQSPRLKLGLFGLSLVHQREFVEQWTNSLEASKQRFTQVSEQFLQMYPDDPWANLMAAYVSTYNGDRDTALSRVRFALEREPSSVRARSLHGQLLAMAGEHKSSIAEIQRAIALSPRAPDRWLQECAMALAHFAGKEYEAAIEWARTSARTPHAGAMPFGVLASSYAQLGDLERAKQATAEIERRSYSFAEQRFGTMLASTNPEIAHRYLDGLRKAAS